MKFVKDPNGIFFFTICHLLFLGLLLFVAYVDDESITYNEYNEKIMHQNPYLTLNKIIFYIFLFLTFISHLKTATTNPGMITNKTNINAIQFYYYIHEPLIQKAIYITEKQTQEAIRKIIFEANNIKFDENENYSLDNDEDLTNNSEIDEKKFEKKTSISEQLKKRIIKNYRLKLTRCRSCYVARPINVHHCSICHGCILERDHHCPWVNNCVGLFNKKYFILFNFYSILTIIYSNIIFFYFALYKQFNKVLYNSIYLMFSILFIIVCIIYGLFAIVLLYEQYDNIKHSCTLIDYNNGILLEKSTFKQQLTIIFQGNFSLKWLLPFNSGGYNDIYSEMSKVVIKNKNYSKKSKYEMYEDEKDKLI